MNIFIIPSWYPAKSNPIAGIFFKEQASYIAELYKENIVGVSLWGQSDFNFAITRNVLSSLKALFTYSRSRKDTCTIRVQDNLYEFFTPTLCLPNRILGGNISGIIKANFSNFEAFQEQFGKVDVIHAHVSYPAGYAAMVLADHFKIPYIITEHMGPFPFREFLTENGKIKSELALPIERATKMIAVSPKLKSDITKHGFQEPIFIPNVINEDYFTPNKNSKSSPFQFFTLANLSPEKGIDDLLQAIKIVTRINQDVTFKIGGGGRFLNYYKAKSKTMGLEQYVEWLGVLTRSEAREQYQNCNAFILPSHSETFGVVYAEAIASGKPVIATRCGGPECIVDEHNGLLANVKDPQNLSEKILYMIERYTTFNSEEIRRGFEDKFSKKAVIPKIQEVYNALA